MTPHTSTEERLRTENAELRTRLEEAEDTLRAIRCGEVEALIVETYHGPQIFSLNSADATSNRLRGEVLAQVSDAVIAVDADQRVTYLNAAAERQYRISAGDVLGSPLSQIYSRQWPSAEAEAAMWVALRKHGEWRGEILHRTHDGRKIPVESSLTLLRDARGADAGMVSAIRDITERKCSEAEFQRVSGLLDTLLHTAPIGFCFLDRDLRFVRINERLAEMNGSSAAAHSGRHVSEIVPTLVDALRNVTDRILATGQALVNHEFSGETPAAPGVRRVWSESWYPVRDNAGEVLGFGGIVEDITERKRADLELSNREAHLRRVINNQLGLVGVIDRDGILLEVDERSLAIAKARREQVIGKHFADAPWWNYDPQVARQMRDAMRRAMAGEVVRYDVSLFAHGAEGVMIDFMMAPVLGDDGEVEYLIPSGVDIRERYAAQERLRQLASDLSEADRRKDEFLATLAHELRNPLAPIRNGLQIMKMTGDDAEAVERSRSMMERQIEQMVRLVDDLMDISRINQGKIELRKEHVSLGAVIASAVETSRPLIEQMGHEFTVVMPKPSIIVDADSTRLAQVFMNLLTNSAKYSERGGHIWLTVERQGSDVVVSVRDTGIGIPADKLTSIFDMFSQVDRSLEKSQGGLGIGLSLVKRLVEMHGGRIEAKSDGPVRGSEFVVRLPVDVEASRPQAADKQEPAAPKSSLRILIVDDNMDGADSLAMMLKMMGNDARTAYDGQEGVELAEEFRPEVVLFDIGMPKLNGYEACRLIRKQPWGRKVIVIAITGWGQDDDRQRSHDAGFDHHMVKPVDPQTLMKLLAGLDVGRENPLTKRYT